MLVGVSFVDFSEDLVYLNRSSMIYELARLGIQPQGIGVVDRYPPTTTSNDLPTVPPDHDGGLHDGTADCYYLLSTTATTVAACTLILLVVANTAA